jgi:glycosyltransferase involved in cell wall biosynthesis
MKVNLYVPGAANLQFLVKHLEQLGVLNRFYYSHKLSTSAEKLEIPKQKAINIFIKEYLTQGHLRLFNAFGLNQCLPLYYRIWESLVLMNWSSAPVSHILLFGASQRIIQRARSEGSRILGLAANSHPKAFHAYLSDEANRIGVALPKDEFISFDAIAAEISLSDHLHVESEFSKASYVEHGFPAERIHIVRPGKDLSKFYPETPGEAFDAQRKFVVLCVGRISLRKGQLHLLEAWRELNLPNAELVLIGNIAPDIKHKVNNYSGEFTYVRRVDDLRKAMVASSVVVVPSVEDGHAHVVGEALACGVPVITTHNTGAADLIVIGESGYVVKPSSAEALAKMIDMLYRDRELLSHLHEQTTRLAVPDWKETANELLKIYQAISPCRDGFDL